MQLIKVSWKTESVLALNKKTESELELSVFYLVPKHFWPPKTLYSIAHDSALNVFNTGFSLLNLLAWV